MQINRLDLVYSLFSIVNQNKTDDPDYVLAKYFLEHYTELSKLNIHEVAADCYVSRSSVRRFCQQIGYDNFKDLKDEFREFDYQYNYFMKLTDRDNYREWLAGELAKMVNELNQRMDTSEVDRIVERIHDSENVVFLSSYSSILFLMEFQRPLILSGKLVRVMTDTNMDIDFLLSLGENDYVMTVSATGNFARAVMPVITQIQAYKALMTTARISELETPYDRVYHLSANDYSNVKSIYSKYGMEYVFDNLYSTYVRRYGTIIKNTK